jgi:hypothetical protein
MLPLHNSRNDTASTRHARRSSCEQLGVRAANPSDDVHARLREPVGDERRCEACRARDPLPGFAAHEDHRRAFVRHARARA